MKWISCCLTVLWIGLAPALAAPPSFDDASACEGWTPVRGEREAGAVLKVKGGAGQYVLQTAAPVTLPIEATFRFRAGVGDALAVSAAATTADAKTPPLLASQIRVSATTSALLLASADGRPMATTAIASRTWSQIENKGGSATYGWRFPRVKNLWDEPDRRDIGSAYAALAPFPDKIFTLRLVLTPSSRQVWVDDRLLAEEHADTPAQARLLVQLDKGAQLLSASIDPTENAPRFLPLPLTGYSHAKAAQVGRLVSERATVGEGVPVLLPRNAFPDLALSESLYRYRLTHGSGPDASYVDGNASWPSPLQIDPASLTFRVPHRAYQNAWLLAWVDDAPNSLPQGNLQFYRERAGHAAATPFEVSDRAIAAGLVRKLAHKTPAGKPLYLVKVPLDTNGLYGLSDMADQFLDFELTRPLALRRSYPDPIYYGHHPGGLPSSLHIVGITLEEAPFTFDVTPARVGHVFQRPQQPGYVVTLRNLTSRELPIEVAFTTKSYDGTERGGAASTATVPAHATVNVDAGFELHQLGWHSLQVTAKSGDIARECRLSLVTLPPNARTYGNAPNETRFGSWNLLGHYTAFDADPASPVNDAWLGVLHDLGIRRISLHKAFFTEELLKKHSFLPNGPHTVGNAFRDAVAPDGKVNPEPMAKAVASEAATVAKGFPESTYFYGGEWHISREVQYAPWPAYTGDGERGLNEEESRNAARHVTIFSAIGQGIRAASPDTKLVLQWGAPTGTNAYLRAGMPKNLVDMFGMDAPQFELIPEISNVTGSLNQLWLLRQEAAKLGWPRLPIAWCEGPFFPTNPGALTEADQADFQIRTWLLTLAYGVEQFQAGIVPHDAGNYYGAEHYGAGVFARRPLSCPKPAVAAIATATSMLCGFDLVGPVDLQSLTNYCLAFRRPKDGATLYALWRVTGQVDVRMEVTGKDPVVTDAMGNPRKLTPEGGAVTLTLSPSPVWLTGADKLGAVTLGSPRYDDAPAPVSRPIAPFNPDLWRFDTAEDKSYAYNHFAIRRVPEPALAAAFKQAEPGHPDALALTLPVQPTDRPLATRYGQLHLNKPVQLAGKPSAIGVWIKGNASWGRVVYQLHDAKGEVWTSVGTRDDWNCDDTHGWSYISFEGWRYVRFPLPGNQPWDAARDLETTWWGSHGGDGIVDLPLSLDKIIVEARNEVPCLGVMKLVPERTYKLAGLAAEYATPADATDRAIELSRLRRVVPDWLGPAENLVTRLQSEGVGDAPAITGFDTPQHFNDGRSMHIRFKADPALRYNLYLSRYPDGRGAELLRAGVTDNLLVAGLRPEVKLYLFLTSVDAGKKESKPSPPFELVTHDHFAEK